MKRIQSRFFHLSVVFNFIIFMVMIVNTVTGDTLRVDTSVPSDYQTIQAASDAAQIGDTVQVAGGTPGSPIVYSGNGNANLDFGGKDIIVESDNGPETCIIDGENQQETRGFIFGGGETANAAVRGFTIRNGNVSGDGGGILCIGDSTPTIELIFRSFLRYYCEFGYPVSKNGIRPS